MHPILIRLGPVTLHSYGLMMAIGVGLALWFIYVQAKARGLHAPQIVDAGFYVILVSLVGAKLVLFIGNFSYYTRNPGELLSLAKSGGVFQGGLAFGVVFALLYFRRRKIPVWPVADIAGPALALGHGFGRIGCFLAGCCYGRECPAFPGVTFGDSYAHDLTGIPLHKALHPVQLYESILNFLNFCVLFLLLRRKRFDGQVFAFYIINYSVIRFFTEYFRGDHRDEVFLLRGATPFSSLSYPQFFCLVGLAGGLLFLFIMRQRSPKTDSAAKRDNRPRS